MKSGVVLLLALGMFGRICADSKAEGLRVGFGKADITPAIGTKPVYLAGFGKNRVAEKVHDRLFARAVVLAEGEKKIALVSVDLVGLFLPVVKNIREQLPGFDYVLVSSTHNHEGPDTLGLWGPNFFQSGVDSRYLKKIEVEAVKAVREAEKTLAPCRAKLGTVRAPELLHDNREPYLKHDELVALQFLDRAGKPLGIVVLWNCHPETLGDKNREVSADFPAATVSYLEKTFTCPAVYFTGTVGGLMTSLRVPVEDDNGAALADGTFAKTERYGLLVGRKAEKALKDGKELSLVPFEVRRREIFLPIDNSLYVLAWKLGVFDRPVYFWKKDSTHAEAVKGTEVNGRKLCVQSETAWLRLGDLEIAAIPGEIYPELVLGKVQDPADPGADFPDAPLEPSIFGSLKGRFKMVIGLANDELGYILPKRQWDEKPPFCYGRKKAQYGEGNSLGPETGPLLCEALRKLTAPDWNPKR